MAGHIHQVQTGTRRVGQSANRRYQLWEEIPSGRVWASTVDIKDVSQAPASPPEPQFTAPVVPGPEYIKMVHGEPGIPYGKIRVDYDRWIGDLEQSWTDRMEVTDRLARAMSAGDQSLYGVLVANPSAAMLGHLGLAPLNPKYALACREGDRWALGLDPWDGTPETMPKWARKLWPDGIIEPARQKPKRKIDFLYETDEGDEFPRSAPMRPRGTSKGRKPKAVAAMAVPVLDPNDTLGED